MKNGKKPTVRQAKFIQKNICLNPKEWLVAKDTSTEMLLVSREGGQTLKFSKIEGRCHHGETKVQILHSQSL